MDIYTLLFVFQHRVHFCLRTDLILEELQFKIRKGRKRRIKRKFSEKISIDYVTLRSEGPFVPSFVTTSSFMCFMSFELAVIQSIRGKPGGGSGTFLRNMMKI